MRARILVLFLSAVFALGCTAGAHTPPALPTNPSDDASSTARGPSKGIADPLFAPAARGWSSVDDQEREKFEILGERYSSYLAKAFTARRATDVLLAGFREGAQELGVDSKDNKHSRPAPGKRYYLRGPGEAAAFVTVGERPIEEGLRIVIAAVDAPHIRLKQQPMYSKHGLAMLDTELYGAPSMEAWLTTPLMLDLYLARAGAAAGDLALTIGDDASEPVFVIPDLLPHLSRRVQKHSIVDSAERMDAVAGRSQQKLVELLGRHGLSARDFAVAEATLVPAAKPIWLGVDRGQIGGYGHEHRALAFVAVEALSRTKPPHYTSMVILVGGRHRSYTGPASMPFVRQAVVEIISALAADGDDADLLATQRIFARSSALVAHYNTGRNSGKKKRAKGGKLAGGVVLVPAADDARPAATRAVIRVARAAGAHYQLRGEPTWGDPARALQVMDIDAVDIAIPIADRSLPMQRISTYDLYQAHRLCQGWFGQP